MTTAAVQRARKFVMETMTRERVIWKGNVCVKKLVMINFENSYHPDSPCVINFENTYSDASDSACEDQKPLIPGDKDVRYVLISLAETM
jgi:hypothetical protein